MTKLLKDETGYSLVEVIVSILILSIAIIPMVGMFDAGLRSATTSSNYDKARSLANKQLEIAKNMPYDSAKGKFPGSTAHAAYNASGSYTVNNQTDPDDVYSNFRYSVVKQCVSMNTNPTNKQLTNVSCNPDPGLVRIGINVTWSNGAKSYSTNGVVGQ